jgi:hypothetical protein
MDEQYHFLHIADYYLHRIQNATYADNIRNLRIKWHYYVTISAY